MAVTFSAGPRRKPTGTPDTVPVRSPASPMTQSLAGATLLVVFAALGVTVGEVQAFAYPALALVGGVALGLGLELRPTFRAFPGLAWAVVVFLGLTIVWAWSLGQTDVPLPFWGVPLVSLLVVGLDWAWAERLRAITVLSGLSLLPFVAEDLTTGVVTGLVWFAVASAALWSARADVVAALPAPDAVAGIDVAAPAPRPTGTVLALLGSWVVAAAVVGGIGLIALQADRADRDPTTFDGSGRGSSDSDGDGLPDTGSDLDGDGRADIDRDGDGRADAWQGSGSGVPGSAPGTVGSGSGPGAGPGSTSGPESGSGSGSRTDDEGGSGSDGFSELDGRGIGTSVTAVVLWVVGVLAVAALLFAIARAVLAALARRRALAARPWPVRMAERLEREGQRRDRPRRRSEPVTAYAAALAGGVLPDPRISEVGAAVSAALFSPGGVDDGVGEWAGSVVDEVTAAHPVPTRWRQARDGRAARAAV